MCVSYHFKKKIQVIVSIPERVLCISLTHSSLFYCCLVFHCMIGWSTHGFVPCISTSFLLLHNICCMVGYCISTLLAEHLSNSKEFFHFYGLASFSYYDFLLMHHFIPYHLIINDSGRRDSTSPSWSVPHLFHLWRNSQQIQASVSKFSLSCKALSFHLTDFFWLLIMRLI